MRPQAVTFGTVVLAALVAGIAIPHAAQPSEADKLKSLVAAYASERVALAGPRPKSGGIAFDRGPAGAPEQAKALASQAAAALATLHTIKTSALTHAQWVQYGIAESQAQLDAENTADFFWLTSVITPYSSGLRTLAGPFQAAPLKTKADEDTYIDALRQLPATMKAYETRLTQQAAHGVALPTEELRLVLPFVRSLAVAPPKSGLSVPAARLTAFAADEQAAFQKRVDDTIATVVNPSINALATYIDGPYRAHTVKNVGLSQYPNGAAYYTHLIHQHTGLTLTPQQIHDRGLAEVTRINGELDKLRVEAGFTGTLAEFKTYLRTDKRFYPTTSQEIGDKMMAAIRIIEPKMAQYFSMMPKAPYGVRRLAPELEPSMTYGIYTMPDRTDPHGYYNYNGLNPETRSVTMVTAIVFHELLPGHHYQLNRLREARAVTPALVAGAPSSGCADCGPMYTAYTEGWGEYSSDLAWEMGAYPDVWTKAGRLGMDLFTSQRLVVDTGMNALGWSREKAMQFMKTNTFEGDTQIDTETLRYSVDMPGQALAYKLGGLAIKDARETMRQAQGASFDIKKFHDYLLDAGEMPLGMFAPHFACLLSGERHAR
ncbi:MAG: DUF885 domain-containing protein [Acidobacteriota bacterium]